MVASDVQSTEWTLPITFYEQDWCHLQELKLGDELSTHWKGFAGCHQSQLRHNGWDVVHASDPTNSYKTQQYCQGEPWRHNAQKNHLSFPQDIEGRTRWPCCYSYNLLVSVSSWHLQVNATISIHPYDSTLPLLCTHNMSSIHGPHSHISQ